MAGKKFLNEPLALVWDESPLLRPVAKALCGPLEKRVPVDRKELIGEDMESAFEFGFEGTVVGENEDPGIGIEAGAEQVRKI